MYTKEQLQKYPFFSEKLDGTDLRWVLDSLTGVISRPLFLDFIRSLIEEKIPFTFGLFDLDNFKFINDNYGHHAGDVVLRTMGETLSTYFEGIGLVGRFGGDEFIFVDFKDIEYDEKKAFLKEMYESEKVVRRNIKMEDCSPLITATVGCASYPADADNLDDLFALMDKALYRGKTKGRNCYIIYVEEKHRHIKISRIAKRGIYTNMQSMVRAFEMVNGLTSRLQSVMPLLQDEMHITDLYYADTEGFMHSVLNQNTVYEIGSLSRLSGDDIYTASSPEDMKADLEKNYPMFLSVLQKLEIESLLVMRIGMDNETYGQLILAEPHSHRIWQEEEGALLYLLAKMIAARICLGRDHF